MSYALHLNCGLSKLKTIITAITLITLFTLVESRRRRKGSNKSRSSSTSTSISTDEIENIINELKLHQYRDSTRKNYYGVWKTFNQFFVKLDKKPNNWEDCISLFAAYLIDQEHKSMTVKSYVSAIKVVLGQANIAVQKDTCLLKSLTQVCRLTKDKVSIRIPIQKDLLNIVLKSTEQYFGERGQTYLRFLYMSLFSTAYYGMFRVGELTEGPHTIKACDVHIGQNKNKILFILRSLKMHNKGDLPQMIKISSSMTGESREKKKCNYYCPYHLFRTYLSLCRGFLQDSENFFVFFDRTPVMPTHFRSNLKSMLNFAGLETCYYSPHGLRSGRSIDLLSYGVSVETIKKLGQWKSNAVYAYLK